MHAQETSEVGGLIESDRINVESVCHVGLTTPKLRLIRAKSVL